MKEGVKLHIAIVHMIGVQGFTKGVLTGGGGPPRGVQADPWFSAVSRLGVALGLVKG